MTKRSWYTDFLTDYFAFRSLIIRRLTISLCGSESSSDGFGGFKIVKCPVGYGIEVRSTNILSELRSNITNPSVVDCNQKYTNGLIPTTSVAATINLGFSVQLTQVLLFSIDPDLAILIGQAVVSVRQEMGNHDEEGAQSGDDQGDPQPQGTAFDPTGEGQDEYEENLKREERKRFILNGLDF